MKSFVRFLLCITLIFTFCSCIVKIKPAEIPVGCENSPYYQNKLAYDITLTALVTAVNGLSVVDPDKYEQAKIAAAEIRKIIKSGVPITLDLFKNIPNSYLIFATPLVTLLSQTYHIEFDNCFINALDDYLAMVTG